MSKWFTYYDDLYNAEYIKQITKISTPYSRDKTTYAFYIYFANTSEWIRLDDNNKERLTKLRELFVRFVTGSNDIEQDTLDLNELQKDIEQVFQPL